MVVVHRTNVINKTIVYSDTVLNLKDTGSNLKVSSISDVSKYSLQTCLNCITEANPDVVFNTIQYSEQTKTVYFYTNKEISFKAWEDKVNFSSVPLRSPSAIIEEIDKVLTSPTNMDSNVISIVDLSKLLQTHNAKYNNFSEAACNELEATLRESLGDNKFLFCLYDFDYKEKRIGFSFKRYDWLGWDKFYCKKNDNGDLYIAEHTYSFYKNDVWYAICDKLSEIYDQFLKFENLYNTYINNIYSLNSNFKIEISRSRISVYSKNFHIFLEHETQDYAVNCNSSIVISKLKGNEMALLEKIYVKIDDCPEWMKDELYSIRTAQLEPKETPKETKKKDSFIKRLFSFLCS